VKCKTKQDKNNYCNLFFLLYIEKPYDTHTLQNRQTSRSYHTHSLNTIENAMSWIFNTCQPLHHWWQTTQGGKFNLLRVLCHERPICFRQCSQRNGKTIPVSFQFQVGRRNRFSDWKEGEKRILSLA
jgi:hypothetical protein